MRPPALRVLGRDEKAPEVEVESAEVEYRRVFGFLHAIRAVVDGRACLTEEGFLYLGLPFRFPGGDLS